jgi:predicted protein tyrosine phosphatase
MAVKRNQMGVVEHCEFATHRVRRWRVCGAIDSLRDPIRRIVLAILALMKRVLFICSQNRLRSPTAERVFSDRPGFEVASAGLNSEVETPVSPELLEWADVIFVMERSHRNKLSKKFRAHLKTKRVICLDIPDEFEYMDPALIALLEAKVGPFFRVS